MPRTLKTIRYNDIELSFRKSALLSKDEFKRQKGENKDGLEPEKFNSVELQLESFEDDNLPTDRLVNNASVLTNAPLPQSQLSITPPTQVMTSTAPIAQFLNISK